MSIASMLDKIDYWFANTLDTREDLDKALGQADRALLLPQVANEFANGKVNVAKMREALGKVAAGLEKVEGIESNYFALRKINHAAKILSNRNTLYADPKKAAAAFDELFQGLGDFAEKLPFPANQFAQLISECGATHFFETMHNVMAGPGSNLYEALNVKEG